MSQYPNQSWMASCSGRTKLTPRQFCFPGTHDSGAYQTPDFTPVASSEAMAKSVERFAPGFQEVAARWAISQPGASFYEQLMNGVRFFDLRVSYAKDEKGVMTFFLIHTFVVCRFADALDDIARFLASHPTELVMLAAYQDYQVNPQLCQELIESKLGKYMYTDTTGDGTMTETVDEILKKGKQVIALWDGPRSQRINYGFWTVGDFIYSFPFLSVDNVAAKQSYITSNLQKYMLTQKGKLLFQLTYTLTEVPIDVAASVFAGGSLKKFADTMNPTMMSFVLSLTKDQRSVINIITNDDQVNSQNVNVALMLIAERTGETVLPELGVLNPLSQSALPPKPGVASSSAWVPPQHHVRVQNRRRGLARRLCCCCCAGDSDNEESEKLVKQ